MDSKSLEILKGLHKQATNVMYGPVNDPLATSKIANVVACLLDVLVHEETSKEKR